MTFQTKNWQLINKLKTKNDKQIIDELLKNRGIKSDKDKREFFYTTLPEKITPKSLGINQAQITKAIKRLKEARKKKEKIIVYGDYDADGISATAILWETLFSLGFDAMPYIPERFSEGYGLNIDSIEKLKKENPTLGLIITVDHGIVANKKVDAAGKIGVDVIITDHHQPGKTKPKAFAIIHTTQIGGAAVSWIFAREVLKKIKKTARIGGKKLKLNTKNNIELAAIGTIADQLPLIGPNRSIAKYGIEALRQTKRCGLLAIFEEAVINPKEVGTYEIGYLIAPRINAMGRMEHAIDSLRLICTPDKKRAKELAMKLGKTNAERQRVVEEVVVHASSAANKGNWGGVIVLAHESYHEGVIGLAAGKLVEEYYRPAIVISKKDGISKASARSIAGFNIIEAIRRAQDLLEDVGGHPMAAGFSIKTEILEKFIKRLDEISIPLLTPEILTRNLKVDLEIKFDQINSELLTLVKLFSPTGLGNPTPTFLSKNVFVESAKVVGKDSKHLSLKVMQGTDKFKAIAFGMGSLYSAISKTKPVDIVYSIEDDTWNGNKNIQLKVKDIKS